MKDYPCPYMNERYCSHKRVITYRNKRTNKKLCIFKKNPNRCPYYAKALKYYLEQEKEAQRLSQEELKAIGKEPKIKRMFRGWGRSYGY